MIKLNSLVLNGIPRIAVGFIDETPNHLIEEARNFNIDVAELRIDQYASFDEEYVLEEVIKFKDFPTIATIRLHSEGGGWNLSEIKRLALFNKIISKVSAVDIELSAEEILSDVIRVAHANQKLIFLSYHNFDRTPTLNELNTITDKAKSLGADVVKIATLAIKREDIQTLANFTIANAEKNLVTIAMGPLGVLSRIFFPALGSLLTYAFLGQPTAPGQLDYNETFELLRKFYPGFNEEKIEKMKIMEYI